MSKKKEDNRDIYDKVAEYLAPVAGAVVGGGVGKRIAKSAGKKGSKTFSRDPFIDSVNARSNYKSAAEMRDLRSQASPGLRDYYDDRIKYYRSRGDMHRNRVLANNGLAAVGGAAGAGGGYVATEEVRKRRK